MEVNAVNIATSVVQQQTYAGRSPTQSVERSGQNDEAVKSSRAREAQVVSRVEQAQAQQQAQQAQRQELSEPPKPVVNAQGQKTGTIINTTA